MGAFEKSFPTGKVEVKAGGKIPPPWGETKRRKDPNCRGKKG